MDSGPGPEMDGPLSGMEMLGRLPVEGKVVTLEAGNMNRAVTQAIAKMLHVLRVWVTTWLRRAGFRYVPDGQRCMEAHHQDLPLGLLYGV